MEFTVKKQIDSFGRIMIPKTLRDYYKIALEEEVFLTPTGDGILITKVPSEKEEKNAEQ